MYVLAEKDGGPEKAVRPLVMLAMETTGPWCSVALLRGKYQENVSIGYDDEPAEMVSQERLSHLQALLPMAEQLLAENGVKKTELTHIAVSKGPGSFTGIRIGVATARALGQALDIPVIGVPTLDSFLEKTRGVDGDLHQWSGIRIPAAQAEQLVQTEQSRQTERSVQAERPVICGILNARRGQVYGIIEGYMPGCPCMLTDVLAIISGQVRAEGHKVLFYGDGIDAYERIIVETLGAAGMTLDRDYYFAAQKVRYQNAAAVARAALLAVMTGRTCRYDALHPDYMRKTEAEQKLQAGELPICKLPKQE